MDTTAAQSSISDSQRAPTRIGDGTGTVQTTGRDEFKRLLMGSGHLNLSAVRARAEDLRRTLHGLIVDLQLNAHNIRWGHVLERSGVLNVQIAHLREQLRPLLKHYVVHPKSVNRQNEAILPIMLATKQLPEMEAAEQLLLASSQSRLSGMGPAVQYDALQQQMEGMNQLVDKLCSSAGPLDPKGPSRAALALARRAAAAPPPPKRQNSSGKTRRVEGQDLLLAAAVTGEGLR